MTAHATIPIVRGAALRLLFRRMSPAASPGGDPVPNPFPDGATILAVLRHLGEETLDLGSAFSVTGYTATLALTAEQTWALEEGSKQQLELYYLPGGNASAARRLGAYTFDVSVRAGVSGGSSGVYDVVELEYEVSVHELSATEALAAISASKEAVMQEVAAMIAASPRVLFVWANAPDTPTTFTAWANAYTAALELQPTSLAPVAIRFVDASVPDSVDIEAMSAAHILVAGAAPYADPLTTEQRQALYFAGFLAGLYPLDLQAMPGTFDLAASPLILDLA